MKNTKIMKTSTTEKPEGPKWKELGFEKGMWEKCVERTAAKMKKGKNNQKKERWKKKQHQNVLSKGLHERKKKNNNTNKVFENEKEENPPPPPQKKDQEQVKDFEGSGFRGKQQPQNLAQVVTSRSLTFFWRRFYVWGHSEP